MTMKTCTPKMWIQYIILLEFYLGIIPCPTLASPPHVSQLLQQYNQQLRKFNHFGAELAWEMSTHLENFTSLLESNEELILKKNLWNNEWCIRLLSAECKTLLDQRQIYLICRGPRFSSYQLSNLLSLLATLRKTYDTQKACLVDLKCYRMEPELNHLMETSRDEVLLRSAWISWHQIIGNKLTDRYIDLVRLMNIGARQAGHSDIGKSWREEMETGNLKEKSLILYENVKCIYSLIHAFVRFKLEKFYGIKLQNGPIPAHLLGNMWSQRWDSLLDIIWPKMGSKNDLVKRLIGPQATVEDMVIFANEFYMKMGFPSLPPKFFTNSYFGVDNSSSRNCHGSAANMYEEGDYRIMTCVTPTDVDLQVLIHELGHIHYFMAYEHLPTVFQDGANAGFHEAVGDAVTYGLYPNPTNRTLLSIGLAKLPQIAFGLVVDLWRWYVFEHEDEPKTWNDVWWQLNEEFLGIQVPAGYKSTGLDALGKYHIVDNVPYIRYFSASFLQHIFYAKMCGGVSYCTLERRGHKFKRMLSRGTSDHWSRILAEFAGISEVTADPLLKYYKPLKIYLEEQIKLHNIPIGW